MLADRDAFSVSSGDECPIPRDYDGHSVSGRQRSQDGRELPSPHARNSRSGGRHARRATVFRQVMLILGCGGLVAAVGLTCPLAAILAQVGCNQPDNGPPQPQHLVCRHFWLGYLSISTFGILGRFED